MDGLISLVRRLEVSVDVCRASEPGTAERTMARQEVADLRRRIADVPIDREASTRAIPTVQPLALPTSTRAKASWRRVPRIATFTRR